MAYSPALKFAPETGHCGVRGRCDDQKGEDGLSKARRLRLLIGAFLLALSVTLTGCQGGGGKEEKKDEKKDEKKEQKKDQEQKKDEEQKDKEQKKDGEKKEEKK